MEAVNGLGNGILELRKGDRVCLAIKVEELSSLVDSVIVEESDSDSRICLLLQEPLLRSGRWGIELNVDVRGWQSSFDVARSESLEKGSHDFIMTDVHNELRKGQLGGIID